MHIFTFLTICTLIFIGGLSLFIWFTEGGGSIEKIRRMASAARDRLKQQTDSQWPQPKKVIRVHAEDTVEQFICAVVGESFDNDDGQSRQRIIKRSARPGIQVHLEREPDNPYDSNAIGAYIDDQQIGYLKTDVAERLADKIDSGNYAAGASVYRVTGGTKGKPHFGVTLEVTVYLLR